MLFRLYCLHCFFLCFSKLYSIDDSEYNPLCFSKLCSIDDSEYFSKLCSIDDSEYNPLIQAVIRANKYPHNS